jgi:lipopolysaccharide transport system ATP-binding protein
MKPIIEVNHLSKKYKYGESQPYYALRDILVDIAKKPFKIFHKNQQGTNLRKDEFWALKDVSFKVNQGEAIGIIGPNGAGKSTLLKILSRITPPTSGEAILKGRVGSLLEVGTGFHPELTGRENIYLNGAILGMTRWEIRRKFDEIVDFSGVEKFLDTSVKHFSSGMYTRLAFAVAANLESEILVVDEVLAVGDAEFQKKCLGKMDEVSKQGRTILFVSHNLASIRQLCSRSILLDCGTVVTYGSTDKVVNHYLKYNQTFDSEINYKSIGKKDAEITCIKILDKNNKPSAKNSIAEDFSIEIDYQINKPIEDALLCLIFYYQGDLILLSSESDRKRNTSEYLINYQKGKYKTRVKIPAFLFNAGSYYVDISIQHPFIDYIDHKQNINFEILNTNNPKSHVFGGLIMGRMATILDYETEIIHKK